MCGIICGVLVSLFIRLMVSVCLVGIIFLLISNWVVW